MSKVQTPSPHASKKHDKRCDGCQAYVSELDPHPVCLKCVPRECSKELPCSQCASLSPDAWKKWERQQASRRSSSSTKGPKGDSAKGGSKSGKATAPSGHCPDVPSTSKAESPGRSRLAALETGFSSFRAEMASMFASLQGRLTASHPPGPKADESRHCDGGARGGEIFPEVPLLPPEVPPLLVRASDQSPEKIAGRLSKFSGAWSEIGADPWVMRIVQWGYKIPFVTLPPLRLQGQETTYPKGSLKWSSLNQSVQELRNKGAIEPAPLTPGFYSRLFLVRKATGEWRPIIDLSSLNVFVHCPSFTMETPRSILRALQQGQWLTSLDLKDAYFHIGIHPADRRYLRFCHNGTSWQSTVLPFGLSTSPRVFTKILKPVLAYAHLHRVKLHMYLDDWLLNPGTHQEAHEQTSWLKSLCQKLGLVLNLEKSELIPSQVSTYLGIELDTSVGLARPSHKRLTNWLSVAEGFTAQQSPPAVQWLQVLGHLVSLEKLVPYGRIRIRPIQWQLRLQWSQSREKSSKLIPLDL